MIILDDAPTATPAPAVAEPRLHTPPAGLGIRRATLSDAPAIAALMRDPLVYQTLLDMPHPNVETWQTALSRLGPNDHWLCAVHEGRLAGWGTLTVAAETRRRHVGAMGVAISREWWGRGVGMSLIDELLTLADDWLDLVRVELSAFVDNERAVALYRAFGFEIEGLQRAWAYRNGRYIDAHLMARLNPSRAVPRGPLNLRPSPPMDTR